MTEFFKLLSPEEALSKFLAGIKSAPSPEIVPIVEALDRVTFEAVHAPASLPAFRRSTMDGYAVIARDVFGASASLPMYLTLAGEILTGRTPTFELKSEQAALIHTGGMLPQGADAVVQIEVTQKSHANEVEVLKAVAPGENVLQVGDDVKQGEQVLPAGHALRPQDLGGLAALGITSIAVARAPRVGLIATGDEIVPPEVEPRIGQVRNINSYSIGGQIEEAGGIPERARQIVPDNIDQLRTAARSMLSGVDMLVLSAGSSVSVRDFTLDVVNELGSPGVLVHGVAIKPGKPTILAIADGKPVIGLPGNPVSAMISAMLFVVPAVYKLLGRRKPQLQPVISAKLTHNIASQSGRVDYVPVRLIHRDQDLFAEPVFGKSNEIFTLVHAEGMTVVPCDSNGLSEGEMVDVVLFDD